MQLQKKPLIAVGMAMLPFAALGQASSDVKDGDSFSFQADKLEYVRAHDEEWAAYDGEARLGMAGNQLVLKAEGEVASGTLREAKTQMLWGRPITALWGAQLGVRFDHGRGIAQRQWLAMGVQGLAPGGFDIDFAAFAGSAGRLAFELDVGYEIQLAHRVHLRPVIEMDFYRKNEESRGIGGGLAEVVAGLRLKYRLSRELMPYIGMEWQGKFGKTADYARRNGESRYETRFVAGVSLDF